MKATVAPGENGRLDQVQVLPLDNIRPSPENEALYRPVDPDDPAIIEMAASMRQNGVREPLIVTLDDWICSGHRRYAAARLAGLTEVPCRREPIYKDRDHDQFIILLRECNQQRIKTRDEIVREEVASINPEHAYRSLIAHRHKKATIKVEEMVLPARKKRCQISKAKQPFLHEITRVIDEIKKAGVESISERAIHYNLLSTHPLIHASKSDSKYDNDRRSTRALSDLLTRARIAGLIPWELVIDESRPVVTWAVYPNTQQYLQTELDGFCRGYWRNLMQSQSLHVEIACEKVALQGVIEPIAGKYCIPMTLGRGYCSAPPRHDMAVRFQKSGKERLLILLLSDFDPDGRSIAESFARSMRDDFGIENLSAVQVALTAEQIEKNRLPRSMKAKKGTTKGKKRRGKYEAFVQKYGEYVWELEALPVKVLQHLLQQTIDSVIDRRAFNHELDEEKQDAAFLAGVRQRAWASLRNIVSEMPTDEETV